MFSYSDILCLNLTPTNVMPTMTVLSRLEDEFRQVLIRNTLPLDPDSLHRSSLSSSTDATVNTSFSDEFRHVLIGNTVPLGLHPSPLSSSTAATVNSSFSDDSNESPDDVSSHGSGVSFGVDVMSIKLIHPDAVVELREIADRMIRSGYEKECCQVYSSVRRDVLYEHMTFLGVEKLSIEELQRIELGSLDDKIKKWIQDVKIVVRGLLSSEKYLCEQILDGSALINDCFLETSKGCVMQLLNFGEAVVIGMRSMEKLFMILDMYDAWSEVFPYLRSLYDGDIVREAKRVLGGLGEVAIGTFLEFENSIHGDISRKPIQNGEIHLLVRYVMNNAELLVDYSDTINSLLESESMTLFDHRLLVLVTSLVSNVEEKSRMYEDNAIRNIFLMNNMLYIVQRVKGSELRNILGDDWIRKRQGLIQQHATQYLRSSWSKALSCLNDEGIFGSSSNAKKAILKERFKSFNACFEDNYRMQTAWKVQDLQLRDELRISISGTVISAYRTFWGRFRSLLENERRAGRYMKYTPEDLENYLLDLFEGTPLNLHRMRRKST
ncbi:hypothetical protein CASFOL_022119 [Castilleja foliolosa]|uniref:Exocyst subunit Exo70 family protein n=1 Tax=Castilleja foliolosa TaxID=1961234 RepID=A0ABD3D293_9LAMI